jgi:hypothetical protein
VRLYRRDGSGELPLDGEGVTAASWKRSRLADGAVASADLAITRSTISIRGSKEQR